MKLEIKDLSKVYGSQIVLDRFNLVLSDEIYKLSKPSGWGKTTLLRLILGLETPDSGEIIFSGSKKAAVFQENRLLDQLDAKGNLKFALGNQYNEDAAKIMLDKLGLDLSDKKKTADYSGGMKRRLALARALLSDADLLLLDEPFAGLDQENAKRAFELIKEHSDGKVVILVSHEENAK